MTPGLATDTGTANYTICAVIPLYNGGRFIENALRSVFSQTRVPDEVIVVDDGSTDDGPDLVRALAKKYPIQVISQPNAGQGAARNRGVAAAGTDLIAFLDQDDSWYPRHVERLLTEYSSDTTARIGWVYANLDEVDESGLLINQDVLDMVASVHPKTSLVGCLAYDMFVLPSASLLSRKAFLDIGGFDTRLRGYEDDDLFVRLFRAGYAHRYLNESLTAWRIFDGSSSFSPAMAKSRMIYFDKLVEQYPDSPVDNHWYVRDCMAPRFSKSIMGEYVRAVRQQNQAAIDSTVADLGHVVAHREWWIRAAYAVVHRFMRNPVLAQLARRTKLSRGLRKAIG